MGEVDQCPVSLRVAVAVVDGLEVVQIEVKQRGGFLQPVAEPKGVVCKGLEAATVG